MASHRLQVAADDVVEVMLAIAAGEFDEAAMTTGLEKRVEPEGG